MGFFPLDRQLELGESQRSEGLAREIAYLSGAVSSFRVVGEILQRIGQLCISESSVWRCVQEVGSRFQAVEAQERARATALPEQWDPPSRAAVSDQRMGVAMDGAMVHIRDEGWKEVKLGVVFDVAMQPTQDKASGEMIDLAHAVNNRYAAHLGDAEGIGEKTWALARRCGWEQAQDTVVLGDGADWIWNQAALHFGRSRQVLDWYHAKGHLVAAACLLKSEGTPAFTRWLNNRETRLYQGHALQISQELEKAARQHTTNADKLLTAAGYFRNNHQRMNYIEMREENWPIGSGVVESGAKQLKARFSGPGMRWSRTGAKNLLPIRAAVLSACFDHMWAATKKSPQI